MNEVKQFFSDIFSPSTVWNAVASLLAVSVVAVAPLSHSIWDVARQFDNGIPYTLVGTPLGSAYEFLKLMGIPHNWISVTHEYLTSNETRSKFLLSAFGVMGLLCCIAPYEIDPLPSAAASTWWICVAASFQITGSFPIPLLIAFSVRCLWAGLKADRRDKADAFGFPVLHLALALVFAPALLLSVPLGLAVINKNHSPIKAS